ncbi:hypothetical protein DN752_17815 [Echinicola strongylocentroti]|uniref:Terminase n=1 Tax=Echinicola strongylocentroti TaxID=1795355 RepID=A0A2Z4IMK2_9BACT|nr:hypothetical protein [Echinicola strongylocentroti]AWW31838.1 hypothetical protein DN752_17815 [Echinicola strongylocentroti]
MTETKRIHYNIPQLEMNLIRPQLGTCIWGRGTGKTEGPGAEFIARNVVDMPGSLGGIVSITYDKLLNMIIPALQIGWERMGFKENVHYWIRKAPPDHLKIPKCYRQPSTNAHLIKWWNGSAQLLISIDRLHIANGASLAYLYADEVKFFPREKFKEVLLTLRGQSHLYGDLSCCESMLLTTDQPRPEMPGNWIYDLEKDSDTETAAVILAIQFEISELQAKKEKSKSKRKIKQLEQEIDRYLDDINELRKGLSFVSRASTLDNVHALGMQVIENYKKSLTIYEFALSVLNKKPDKAENSFYHLLSDDKHGYYAPNVDFIDGLDSNGDTRQDCRWDGDLVMELPLELGCDYNSAINWVTIGQDKESSFDIINSMFVLKPKKIKNLVAKFDWYYRHKKKENNTVIFNYDHTAIGENAKDDISFADEWINELKAKGWNVIENYIGQSSSHRSRFYLWEAVLAGDERLPRFRINLANNIDLMISLRATLTRKDKKGDFAKDKTSEQKKQIPPEHATHGGEALDSLVWAKFRPLIEGNRSFPLVTSL